MNKHFFKLLCILNLCLLGLLVIVSFSGLDPLPPALAEYNNTLLEQPISSFEVILAICSIAALIAQIGIIFFANWARHTYTACVVITTVGMAFSTPTILSPIEAAIIETSLVISGMLIAMAYFTNLCNQFKNT